MPSTIPLDGTLDWFTAQVTLDGEEYLLEFSWNARDSRWYLGLSLVDGTVLASGRAIVVDYPLLRGLCGGFPGYLMAHDATGNGAELIVKEDLGVRVLLMYFDEAEVDAL